MSLTPGVRLGPYEILVAIGAGGMGEVYRARDTKLNRDVALKILPEAFAFDSDRLARFKREAQVLASLNHPNIGAIYGLEDSGGVHALVLELVEGPTLADRIAQGPVSLDDAMPIAQQIADALDAAHEQGIVHRDLKPVNIKLRSDGTVKVLDFGLAKALEGGEAAPVQADRHGGGGYYGGWSPHIGAAAGGAGRAGLVDGRAELAIFLTEVGGQKAGVKSAPYATIVWDYINRGMPLKQRGARRPESADDLDPGCTLAQPSDFLTCQGRRIESISRCSSPTIAALRIRASWRKSVDGSDCRDYAAGIARIR